MFGFVFNIIIGVNIMLFWDYKFYFVENWDFVCFEIIKGCFFRVFLGFGFLIKGIRVWRVMEYFRIRGGEEVRFRSF